jgi:hypothetical protein
MSAPRLTASDLSLDAVESILLETKQAIAPFLLTLSDNLPGVQKRTAERNALRGSAAPYI